jgi:hypothetical protein
MSPKFRSQKTFFSSSSSLTSSRPWPVWRESVAGEVRFAPMTRRNAYRLYNRALAFERATRARGRQDGKLGRNGLAILRALIFRFLNFRTGRLDPSYAAIAREAAISERSVGRGLVALKAAGVLTWLRRCYGEAVNGIWQLIQETNAYGLQSEANWKGWTPIPDSPPPEHWGAPDHVSGALEAAGDAVREGRDDRIAEAFELEPADRLAAQLASFARRRTSESP